MCVMGATEPLLPLLLLPPLLLPLLLLLEDLERLRADTAAESNRLIDFGVASGGPEFCQAEVWQAEFAFAREHHLPITAHAMMDRGIVERVRSISEYRKHGVLGPDVLLIHVSFANDDELRYLAATGTPVSIAMASELRYGMGIPPVVKMMESGVLVSLSIDTMPGADSSDMFGLMRLTLLVERGRQERVDCYQPDQVLRQATRDGARALGMEDQIGSLTPGKRADVILVRMDELNVAPMNVPVGQVVLSAQPRNVDSVWIDGIRRKADGELTDASPRTTIAAAERAVAELGRRLGKAVE